MSNVPPATFIEPDYIDDAYDEHEIGDATDDDLVGDWTGADDDTTEEA